jgi:hypothetical protein
VGPSTSGSPFVIPAKAGIQYGTGPTSAGMTTQAFSDLSDGVFK